MTVYTPQPQLLIDGVDFNSLADYNIVTNTGRESITEQPQPGYTSITLYTDWDTELPVNLNAEVEIKLNNLAGTYVHIFSGNVTDIAIAVDSKGSIANQVTYTLTVVDTLAALTRRTVGYAGYPKQKDGERILAILSDALLSRWSEVDPILQWAELDNATTWETYDGINNDVVNALATQIDAGAYELEVYSDGAAIASDLVNVAANSGRGMMYAKPDGSLAYDDYASRSPLTSFMQIETDEISANVSYAIGLGELVNSVEVTYRAGSEFARDEQSVAMYGEQFGQRTTVLHDQSAAQSQAQDFIDSRAYPRKYPKAITVNLINPSVYGKVTDLVNLGLGKQILILDMPQVFGSEFLGFVEGYSWQLTKNNAEITMQLSARSETYAQTKWVQVANATTWATYNPATDWTEVN